MALLNAGEGYFWSSKATDESFSKAAVKLRCTPKVTQHSGPLGWRSWNEKAARLAEKIAEVFVGRDMTCRE